MSDSESSDSCDSCDSDLKTPNSSDSPRVLKPDEVSKKLLDETNLLELVEIFKSIKYYLRNNEAEKALSEMDAILPYKEIQTPREQNRPWAKRWARKIQYSGRPKWLSWMSVWHLLDSKSINSLIETINECKKNLQKEKPIILEIGAGMGFLAYFLRHYGIEMIATDSYEEMKDRKPFTEVLKMDYETALQTYDPDILIVVWGRSSIPFHLFKGKYYIYIGEPYDGATSGYPNDEEEGEPDGKWKIIKEIEMPCFYGLNDENIIIFGRE